MELKKPYKRISFNEHKPFLQAGHKHRDTHTHTSTSYLPYQWQIRAGKNLPTICLRKSPPLFTGNLENISLASVEGEILQHKAQPWALQRADGAAVKQPFNKALKCHRLGHREKKKKSYENKCLSNN